MLFYAYFFFFNFQLVGIRSSTRIAPCYGRSSWTAEKQEEILREDQLGEYTECLQRPVRSQCPDKEQRGVRLRLHSAVPLDGKEALSGFSLYTCTKQRLPFDDVMFYHGQHHHVGSRNDVPFEKNTMLRHKDCEKEKFLPFCFVSQESAAILSICSLTVIILPNF